MISAQCPNVRAQVLSKSKYDYYFGFNQNMIRTPGNKKGAFVKAPGNKLYFA